MESLGVMGWGLVVGNSSAVAGAASKFAYLLVLQEKLKYAKRVQKT